MVLTAAALGVTRWSAALPAFPGAEGFGADTPGGRGGKVIVVSALADSGPGSLREAVDAPGSRIVVFAVGGTIVLESPLVIPGPFITIAGQTAPGGGILIRDYGPVVSTHDVVLRFLRVRIGAEAGVESDGISITPGSENRGMPDDWEKSHGLDPNDPFDAGRPASSPEPAYTNIEVCINEIAEKAW